MDRSVSSDKVDIIRQEILGMHLSRLIIFSDVINRYHHLRIKNANEWLRVDAVLFLITRQGKLTPSELAKLMLRSRNSITKLIEGLERDGYIQRSHSSRDRRTVYIEVTPKGMDYAITNLKCLTPLEEEVRSCLDDSELQTLIDLSRKLRLKLLEKLTGLKS
jgi:DNA-binding MarR family transcriptional regulator